MSSRCRVVGPKDHRGTHHLLLSPTPALTVAAAPKRRARLDLVLMKGLAVLSLALAVLGGSAALGSAAGDSESSDPIAQAEQPDTEGVPSPSDSDDEIRLAMALLITVAAVALLGTLVYWVRTGDSHRSRNRDSPSSPEREDTLG